MATLPLSFAIHSNFLSGGPTEYSKFIPNIHCDNEKKREHSFEKMDLKRNPVYGEALKNPAKISCQNRSLKVLATSRISVVQTEEVSSSYLFRTEIGDQVKVLVRKRNTKYGVYVEVSSLHQHTSSEGKLVMCWGIFRSDSSYFLPLDFQNSAPDVNSKTIETPFVKNSLGKLVVELDFDASLSPFYLSFLLKSPLNGNSRSAEIRSHRNSSFCVPIGLGSGYPAPLGLSFSAAGSVNFALFSRSAEGVILCLYDKMTTEKPTLEIDLDPYINRSGDIWHVSLESALPFVSYGYRCKMGNQEVEDKSYEDRVLLDPYAKIISCSSSVPICLGKVYKEPVFDWRGDVRPCLPLEKLLVYRLNVTRFTKDNSSKLGNDVAGTFLGIPEKLQYFKDLGVNTILLEPIFPFDEKKGPYFPFHFFSLGNLYGDTNSLKEMVKKLHSEGIEVFLEVVFTHTADDVALREIDSSSYYYANGVTDLGTQNALNCNYPIVQRMILDSLRQWVIEYHIDGFCFINASHLLRGFRGEILSRPPLVEAISFDPILSNTKIIADCWDPHDMATKEIRFPHWKRWAEINTKFCDDVRNFLRGEGLLSNLATRLCGSGDIFLNGRGPAFSFNFIARNSGLPLLDLVSFSNVELASELSWNCGEEGPTNKTAVLERRLKQIRNFYFILFISLGVPVLNMGDECGQSSWGSLSYGERKPFDWSALKTGFGIQTTKFISYMSSLRVRRADLLQKKSFLKEENIAWNGSDQSPPNWEDPSSRFIAMTLKTDKEEIKLSSESMKSDKEEIKLSSESIKGDKEEIKLSSESKNLWGDLFVAFNGADQSESVVLPPSLKEMKWLRLVDTALPFPGFFSEDGETVLEQMAGLITYEMKSHSCVLFEARRVSD